VILLNHLSQDFTWISHVPRGRCRSLLLGVRIDIIDVLASSNGTFHIKLYIHYKDHNFISALAPVYGADEEEYQVVFPCELVNLAEDT
jgi:hypothetical protein